MGSINSPDELKDWLKDKPASWSAVIALRLAERVLPLAIEPIVYRSVDHLPRPTLVIFRAVSVSAVACNSPTAQTAAAANSAANAARAPVFASARTSYTFYAARTAHFAALAASSAANEAITRAAYLTADTVNSATRAAADLVGTAAPIWEAVLSDLDFLVHFHPSTLGLGSVGLIGRPLWPEAGRGPFAETWDRARAHMIEIGSTVWVDWYERRLRGTKTRLALPPEQDQEFGRRLIAQEVNWWEREPSLVNADIQSWIDELTPDPLEAQLETAEVRLEIGVHPDWNKPEAEAALDKATDLAAQTENQLAQVEEALDQLAVDDDGRLQIGGNYPPEPIDVAAEEAQSQLAPAPISANQALLIKAEVAQARTEVAQVREELTKDEPRVHWLLEKTKRIRETAIALRQLLTDICGESFTNEFGKWLGTGSALVLVVSAIWYTLPKAIVDAVLAAL